MELGRVKNEGIPDDQAIFAFRGRIGQKYKEWGPKMRSLGNEKLGLLHVEAAWAGPAVSNGPIVPSRLR